MQQIVDFPSSKMTQQQLARDSWEVSPSELWKKLNIFACMSWLHWLKEKRWRKLVMCLLNEGYSGKLQTERIPMKKIFTLNTLFWHEVWSSIDIYCISFNNDLGFQNLEVPSPKLTAQQKNLHYRITALLFFSNILTYAFLFIILESY